MEKEVMNPVQRNWCFEPNSIDAKVRNPIVLHAYCPLPRVNTEV